MHFRHQILLKAVACLILLVVSSVNSTTYCQEGIPEVNFTISLPGYTTNSYHVELQIRGVGKDSLDLKMPKWMPGYYQIMDYADDVNSLSVKDIEGKSISWNKPDGNTWRITGIRDKTVFVNYDILTSRHFVANSYVDSTHAYIVPANSFLYIDNYLNIPVTLKIENKQEWEKIATGLEMVPGSTSEFAARDFDILYDCPILIGNLEELSPFKVSGIEHRFIGYKIGSFDKRQFIGYLKRVVETAVGIIGDIPYKDYTFIALGPGRGGIEHLNSTTISFDGNRLTTQKSMNQVLAFIAHEYFHHFNVKRIRPFELGPFDYSKENRTNQLWVSEGLTVYYEYLILRRAGLLDEKSFLSFLEGTINAYENDQGRHYQSLQQASYNTWSDGPFGTRGGESDKSISYYDKGAVVGMMLDFAIRNATSNERSLDDVMRKLYWQYYKQLKRGFTEAEFQEACESIAGISLTEVFEYIYTTKELDYNKYFNYAGLKVERELSTPDNLRDSYKLVISRLEIVDELQSTILNKLQTE